MTKSKANSCPLCRQRNIKKFWAMSGYRLSKCISCGMVWDFLPPEDPRAIYDERYFINENPKGGYANYFEGMKVNKKTFDERLKKIEKKLGKKGRLLDVGCALGDCLIEAKKLGWREIEGLEVSNYAYMIAKNRGLNIKKGNIGDNYKSRILDVILYQDVLEHINDPVSELKKAYKILKPGGLIYIVTPDIEGWWARILGHLWYHYKPFEHLVYFSKNTIALALEKAGFRNISVKPTYHVLSLEYIINRLRYYAPDFFEFILKIVKKSSFKNVSFKAYIGELEAWGYKS